MKYLISILATACLVLVLGFYLLPKANASATNGLPATLRVATTTVVGPQNKVTLFNSNSACTSRIVRTQGQGIILAFADPTNGDVASTTLSSVIGFIQAASTTIAYDSGIYGCGRVTAYAEASTTLTTEENY